MFSKFLKSKKNEEKSSTSFAKLSKIELINIVGGTETVVAPDGDTLQKNVTFDPPAPIRFPKQ